MKEINKVFVNEQEASTRYGLSRFWFQKLRSQKKGPCYLKIKRKVLYKIEDLDNWFNKYAKHNENDE